MENDRPADEVRVLICGSTVRLSARASTMEGQGPKLDLLCEQAIEQAMNI